MNSIAFDVENEKRFSSRIQKFFRRYQVSSILKKCNAYSPTTIIAPISRRSHTKANLPTHYPLESVAGLAQPSVVLPEQIRVIDKGRLDRRIGMLSGKSMWGIDKFSKKYNLPHIHPHAFRHTAASTMIANGVDLVTTANELGHANASTTASIYAHQIAIAKAKAADVRAGVFADRSAKPKEKRA